MPVGPTPLMSWEHGGDTRFRGGHPLLVGRSPDGAFGEEIAGARVMPVPVRVVGEMLTLGLVLAFGGAGEEGNPGEVRDKVILVGSAVVRPSAVLY